MRKELGFKGFSEDTFRFFWDIAFQNEQAFFETNRARYRANVYEPLLRLSEEIGPTVAEIDDRLNVKPSSTVSRIRRDTRYTHDKSPYRDHAWIAFRMPGAYISESFSIYAEISRDAYGYGMGMYAPNATMMQAFRQRIFAQPVRFLELINEPAFAERFTLEGEPYKRDRFPAEPAALKPYLNRKNMSFCFSSPQLTKTMSPALADEVRDGLRLLKPVYRFFMGLN